MQTRTRQKTNEEANCSLARALTAVGDAWSLLILREAFYGTRTFEGFQRSLTLARNTLTDRLNQLVESQLLARVDAGKRGTRFEYQLTERGSDLLPVLVAMFQWGDRWLSGAGREPVRLLERATGRPIQRLELRARSGERLTVAELRFAAGPGATTATRTRFSTVR